MWQNLPDLKELAQEFTHYSVNNILTFFFFSYNKQSLNLSGLQKQMLTFTLTRLLVGCVSADPE